MAKPTAAQLDILAQMTMGGMTLKASPQVRRTTAHRYTLRDSGNETVRVIPRTTVEAMVTRGLIKEQRTSIYAMEWTYRVTETGRAALKAAMEPHEA